MFLCFDTYYVSNLVAFFNKMIKYLSVWMIILDNREDITVLIFK